MLNHRALAKQVAWVTGKNLPVSYEDALSAAYLGLVQAARSFDLSKYATKAKAEATFRHFAWLRMRGSIIDDCRRNSLVRRTDRERGERAHMVSFDDVFEETGEPRIVIGATPGDIDGMIDFCEAMKTLKPRERYILTSLGEGITQREIAVELSITESRVSQIASAARIQLKEKINV